MMGILERERTKQGFDTPRGSLAGITLRLEDDAEQGICGEIL